MTTLRVTAGSSEPVVQRWVPTDAATLVDTLGILDRGRPAVLAINGRAAQASRPLPPTWRR